jgi:hypothetical protein
VRHRFPSQAVKFLNHSAKAHERLKEKRVAEPTLFTLKSGERDGLRKITATTWHSNAYSIGQVSRSLQSCLLPCDDRSAELLQIYLMLKRVMWRWRWKLMSHHEM